MENVELEKVPVFTIYKNSEGIYADVDLSEIGKYELYGFLKLYLRTIRCRLEDELDNLIS